MVFLVSTYIIHHLLLFYFSCFTLQPSDQRADLHMCFTNHDVTGLSLYNGLTHLAKTEKNKIDTVYLFFLGGLYVFTCWILFDDNPTFIYFFFIYFV